MDLNDIRENYKNFDDDDPEAVVEPDPTDLVDGNDEDQ